MQDNYILVSGMFRSGTTLISKVLNAHPGISCVSDVYTPFFNALRDVLGEELGLRHVQMEFLHDYFAAPDESSLYHAILAGDLHVAFPDTSREPLLSRIRSRGRMTCPKIVANLKELPGRTFAEVYLFLLRFIEIHYGKKDTQWIGNKEVWISEFIPRIARTNPLAKFVLMERDPRAVCASKNVGSLKASNKVSGERYPWLFLIRQWRKLAQVHLALLRDPSFKDRLFHFRYEDFVREPESHSRKLCEFLGLPFDHRMIEPSEFLDGFGQRWIQNSSYHATGKADGFLTFTSTEPRFDVSKATQWKTALSGGEIAFIEALCYPEMRYYGYDLTRIDPLNIPSCLFSNPPVMGTEEMQEWIREKRQFASTFSQVNEMGAEFLRHQFYQNREAYSAVQKAELSKAYFLTEEIFDAIVSV